MLTIRGETMKSILLLNGPNLNMLGLRDPKLYGNTTLSQLEDTLRQKASALGFTILAKQSNHEGVLIDCLHDFYYDEAAAGVIINPGALAHYSYALRDAVELMKVPVIEVHITDIYAREDFRQHSVISDVVTKTITGMGIDGYEEALLFLYKK
jgi:3-dehydroquinate dehydratase-2